jgi:hypothetical protein
MITARTLIPLVMLLAPLQPLRALADGADPPMFSFSGFGTLGVVHSSEDRADFAGASFKPTGAGFTRAWSPDVDSLLALQAIANLTPRFSAVLQVESELNYAGSYRPHVEWANLKYQATPDFSIRIGRTGVPIFMVTDTRKLGYANPWVRPPVELYSLVAVTSNDGIDVSYRTALGSATNTIQLSGGRWDTKFPSLGGLGGTAKSRGQWALIDTFESGFATVRANYGASHVTIDALAPLFDGFRQFGPEGIAIADKYEIRKSPVTFIGVGASYDPGPWFTVAEWGRIEARSAVGGNTAWYVSGGLRRGKFTPYATYGHIKVDSDTSVPGLTLANLPPFLVGPATALNGALNSILGAKAAQQTVSLGLRWDFMKDADLKVQIDRTRLGSGSAGVLTNVQPGFRPGGSYNLFSVTLDFAFR